MKKCCGIAVERNSSTQASSPVCGVYAIVHLTTNRRYIGQSQNIRNRWTVHLCELRKGKHHCGFLQNVWNKHSESEFSWVILSRCKVSSLNKVEQQWMNRCPAKLLMNCQPIAGSARGYKHSLEARLKISDAQKRICQDPKEIKYRSDRAKAMHAAGRITYHKRFIRPRVCDHCKRQFIPARLPAGYVSGTKWCDRCRPTHLGGRYKTASKLPVGSDRYYRILGPPAGRKHTEKSKQKIAKASKLMWKRRHSRVLEGQGRPKACYPGV